jgi:hypothetical protein
MPLSDDQRADLERMGSRRVRLLVTNYAGGHTSPESFIPGFPSGQIRRDVIDEWLAEKDHEERLRSEASQIEQNRIARSAKKAAWIAAIAAIVAAIVAIIAAAIAGLAWLYPHT